jgi:hypothetical protein
MACAATSPPAPLCKTTHNRIFPNRFSERELHMQLALKIFAICLMGMGTVWILQGVNILPGSFMTGQIIWAWRGAATALVGLVLLLYSLRRRKN